jgi:hypothetical protein
MNCFFTFRRFPDFRFGYELLEALNPARARVQDFLAGGPVAGSAPTLSAQLAADIAALWADPALGKAYDRRSEFQVQQIYLLIPHGWVRATPKRPFIDGKITSLYVFQWCG